MKKILISPYTRKAKVYPHWQELINMFRMSSRRQYVIIQLGVDGERPLQHVSQLLFNLSMKDLEQEVRETGFFISVDNFLPHMAHYIGVKGVVLFGPSDPLIFGHPTHLNILKSREYLRPQQFEYYNNYVWEHANDGWLEPKEVFKYVDDLLNDTEGEESSNQKDKGNRRKDKKKGGASCSRKTRRKHGNTKPTATV